MEFFKLKRLPNDGIIDIHLMNYSFRFRIPLFKQKNIKQETNDSEVIEESELSETSEITEVSEETNYKNVI